MRYNKLLHIVVAMLSTGITTTFGACARPKAVVYRGPASCQGCPESVADLLRSSPFNFKVVFAGPHEDVDVTEETLKDATMYAHGGGDDQEKAYRQTKRYQPAIKKFVKSGGHYIGICLGAYLAGHSDGYGLLPKGAETDQEITQHGAQVKTEDDTIIQVDWTFNSGQTEKKRWTYFQDGVVIKGLNKHSPGRVIGRYSKNGDVAAYITPYGKGSVGLIGIHPEADKDWYEDEGTSNPEGVKFDIGYDFIEATLNGGR